MYARACEHCPYTHVHAHAIVHADTCRLGKHTRMQAYTYVGYVCTHALTPVIYARTRGCISEALQTRASGKQRYVCMYLQHNDQN